MEKINAKSSNMFSTKKATFWAENLAQSPATDLATDVSIKIHASIILAAFTHS